MGRPKRRANIDKHGLDFHRIEEEFDWDTALIIPAKPSRTGRNRVIFVGEISEKRVAVIVASGLGKEALSIVSFRYASEKERELYAGSR